MKVLLFVLGHVSEVSHELCIPRLQSGQFRAELVYFLMSVLEEIFVGGFLEQILTEAAGDIDEELVRSWRTGIDR